MHLLELFDSLDSQLDAGTWWPADSDFEIFVGAVLTQNTAWSNVEKALENLQRAGVLAPTALLSLEPSDLEELIRPAGFFRAKARYLRAISNWYLNNPSAHELSTAELRNSLLAVPGVGSETADDLLLYVYNRPVFIYDLYARRLLKAAGFGDFKSYEQAKKALDPLVEAANLSAAKHALFHGLIVEAGKQARKQGGYEFLFTK